MSSVGNTNASSATNVANVSSAAQGNKLSRVDANLSSVGLNLGCNHPHRQGGLLLDASPSAVGQNLGCDHPHHQGGLLLHACLKES